jgi:hypothetical protein
MLGQDDFFFLPQIDLERAHPGFKQGLFIVLVRGRIRSRPRENRCPAYLQTRWITALIIVFIYKDTRHKKKPGMAGL